MSHAFEAPNKPGLTLTQQANSQRISRSMFIGHSAGYLLLFAVVIGGLVYAGFTVPVSYDAIFAVTEPPTILHLPYTGLHPYATIGLAALGAVIWTDLTVRRRHDRGRSGVDAIIWQILLFASVIIHTFGNAPDIVGYLDVALILGGLYLFVVLVILPGNRGENRYGQPPRLS
jgi:uncharacterized membrane protein YhaH (DUF805 family)